MPCDTIVQPQQTVQQRAAQVRAAVAQLEKDLARKRVRVVVGPQGAVTFAGWDTDRAGITDACAYRRIMATGGPLARMEIARAEQQAGIKVNRQSLAAGIHSHDGGRSWGTDR